MNTAKSPTDPPPTNAANDRCVSHHHACKCREKAFLHVLALAQPTMKAHATSAELDEWHCRVEDLTGTAYPSTLCSVCCQLAVTPAEPQRLHPSELLAVLRAAPAADLTAEKSAVVMQRDGYNVTGFVLCHPATGNRCIVEMSACRWLTKDESWWLMHVSKELPTATDEPNDKALP